MARQQSHAELAIAALEVALAGGLKSRAQVPRIAFAMLDPDDADIWVLDTTRKSALLAREKPVNVALTLTMRPQTLLELFTASGPDQDAPLIADGDITCLDTLRAAISTPQSALAIRARGFT